MSDDEEMKEIPVKKEPHPPVGTNVESEAEPKDASQQPESGQQPPSDFSELPGEQVSGEPVEAEGGQAPQEPPAEPVQQEQPAQQREAPLQQPVAPPAPREPPAQQEQPTVPQEGMREVKPPEDLKALQESDREAKELLDDSKPRYMRVHEAKNADYPGSQEQAKQDITPVSIEPRAITTEEKVNQAIALHAESQRQEPGLLGWIKGKLGFK